MRLSASHHHSFWIYSFPLVPVLIWAVNMVVTRYAAHVIEPVSISFWRLVIALLVMTPFVLKAVRQQKSQVWAHIGKLTILATLAMLIYQCLSYWAGHSTTATNMSIINAFIPIFTIFVSLIILAEKPSKYAILGSIISISGLLFLISQGHISRLLQGGLHFGDGLMVIAVVSYALYGVLLRHWQLPISLGVNLFAQTVLAIVLHVPLLLWFCLQTLDQHNLAPVLYAGLLASIVAPFMWMKAMQTLGPNRSSMFTNLGPILTAIVAYLYLGEQWMYYHTIGTMMAIAGVILAQKKIKDNFMKQSRMAWWALLLPVSAVLIWSFNIVITRYVTDFIEPMSISFYRWLLAWLLLTPFLLPKVWQQRVLIQPHLLKLAVLSAFGMLLYQGLAYSAAHYTTATNMGLINAFIPIFTIFVAFFILKDRPNRYAISGGILSFIGLLYVIGQGDFAAILALGQHTGDVVMLLAVFFYAFYGVFLKKWQLALPLIIMLYVQICFAVLYHLPLIAYFGLDSITSANLYSVLYAGIFPSLFAPLLWMLAVQQLGPNRTSIFMNLMPIFTAIIAYFWLHEAWTIYHSIGGTVIVAAVILAQRK